MSPGGQHVSGHLQCDEVVGLFGQVFVAEMDQEPGRGVLLALAVAEGPQLLGQVAGRLARIARQVAQRRGPALWPVTAGAGQRTLAQCVWHDLGRRALEANATSSSTKPATAAAVCSLAPNTGSRQNAAKATGTRKNPLHIIEIPEPTSTCDDCGP